MGTNRSKGRKLLLDRERLRALSTKDLGGVGGGATAWCPPSDGPSESCDPSRICSNNSHWVCTNACTLGCSTSIQTE
jgi:hypothetical protein